MWIVPILTGTLKDVFFLTHTRTGLRKKIIACPQVIGKVVLITQTGVTKKKRQRGLGQILIYDYVNGVGTAWLTPFALKNERK
jgi:hypothetical protein